MNNNQSTTKPRFSICILCYGDHLDLAKRCLESITDSFNEGTEHIQDIRIGLNMPSTSLLNYIKDTAKEISSAFNLPVITYEPTPPDANTFKWPLMRRMFYDPHNKIADLIMWFDDDSFLTGQKHWWRDIHEASCQYDLVGSYRKKAYQGNTWDFILTRPWVKKATSTPVRVMMVNQMRDAVFFPQGAWWTAQTQYLARYSFPFPALKHNGGDTLLGEYCRQQNLKIGLINEPVEIVKQIAHEQNLGFVKTDLSSAVKLNIDLYGMEDDDAPRRGYSEPPLGYDYQGKPYDISHQNFQTKVTNYNASGETKTHVIQ